MVNILGLGFTGQRLAWRLLRRGETVLAAVRQPDRFHDLVSAGLILQPLRLNPPETPRLPKDVTLVHLIPPLSEPENSALRAVVQELAPKRVVYISSTGVYGAQPTVDETTPVEPEDDRGRRRVEEETWLTRCRWETLILRAAAIYGPGRGAHVAIRQGRLPRRAPAGMVSRIHADDLSALIEAGIYSELQGAWPVADEEPCSTADIAAACARLLGIDEIAPSGMDPAWQGRRVDGRKIRGLLGVELKYPSWRTGIPASLAEEG